jgi:hypothetical protein
LVLSIGSVSDGLLLFSLGNLIAGLLVGQFGVAIISTPTVSGLLLVFAVMR